MSGGSGAVGPSFEQKQRESLYRARAEGMLSSAPSSAVKQRGGASSGEAAF